MKICRGHEKSLKKMKPKMMMNNFQIIALTLLFLGEIYVYFYVFSLMYGEHSF